MAKLKSVFEKFKQVKEQFIEEKTKKGGNQEYDSSAFFRPQAVKDEDRTKFKIRFLPVEESPTGKPWVQINYHMFKRHGDNKYIKVIDPRTFNPSAQNPIGDLAKKMFDSDNVIDQKLAKDLYRKPRYFTLVYVKEAPENQKDYVGKVLIYEAGKQIYDKLDAAIRDYDLCFWDPYKGQDFMLVLKMTNSKEKYPVYTDSSFIMGPSTPVSEDEKIMDEIGTKLETLKIKDLVIKKGDIKSGEELRELLEGGVKEAEINTSPAKDVMQNTAIENSPEPDFGEIGGVEEPAKTVAVAPAPQKVEAKASAKAPEAAKPAAKAPEATKAAEPAKKSSDAEIDVDFTADDFKFD
jgi:hypothetical protein